MPSQSRRAPWLVFAAGLFGAGGCGSPAHDVTGKVTYNGAPLNKPDGQIVFVGPNGEQVAAPIATDGTYRAAGVAGGSNRIAVYYPAAKARTDKTGKLKPGELPKAMAKYLTPEKYASPETSELSATVSSVNTFDAELIGPKIP